MFRKKPVVDAWLFGGWLVNVISEMPIWVIDASDRPRNLGDESIFIFTKEGTMEVSPGDWIIKGEAGEVYPCKPEIFEATYEKVE